MQINPTNFDRSAPLLKDYSSLPENAKEMIPEDVFKEIFSFLGREDRRNVLLVNKAWKLLLLEQALDYLIVKYSKIISILLSKLNHFLSEKDLESLIFNLNDIKDHLTDIKSAASYQQIGEKLVDLKFNIINSLKSVDSETLQSLEAENLEKHAKTKEIHDLARLIKITRLTKVFDESVKEKENDCALQQIDNILDTGEISLAQKLAGMLKHEQTKARALMHLMDRWLKQDHPSEAINIIQLLPASNQSAAYVRLTKYYLEHDKLVEVESLISSLGDKSDVYLEQVQYYLKKRDPEKAALISSKIENDSKKDRANLALIQYFVNETHVDKSRLSLHFFNLVDDQSKLEALKIVVDELLKKKVPEQAVEFLSLDPSLDASKHLLSVIDYYARKGEFNKATDLIPLVSHDYDEEARQRISFYQA